MKERPILFSGPMICALLEGRKTQTRRIVKFNDAGRVQEVGGKRRQWHRDDPNAVLACPYGDPGDRLWVRETWGTVKGNGIRYVYAADGPPRQTFGGDVISGMKWTPSIHMPRRHSRITLEVTSVRVERLQDITEDDARAEGLDEPIGREGCGPITHRNAFAALWEQINGARASWSINPWVWVIGVRQINGEAG